MLNREHEKISIYFREIATFPRLNKFEEASLATAAKLGNKFAREHLIHCNLHIVVKLCRARHAKTAAVSRISLADMIAEGNLALIRAADTFDPSLGHRFATHVKQHVRPALRDLSLNAAPDRLPFSSEAMTEVIRYHRMASRLAALNSAQPTFDQVVEAMGLSVVQRREMRRKLAVTNFVGPGGHAGGRVERLLVDVIPSRNVEPDQLALVHDLVGKVLDLLDRLDPEDARVIRLRYGIGGGEPKTQAEVAREVGMSKVEVYRAERNAKSQMAEELGDD